MVKKQRFVIGALLVVVSILVFAVGASWVFAQGASSVSADAASAPPGASVFVWQGDGAVNVNLCFGVPATGSDCTDAGGFGSVQIPLPSDGHLTKLAIHPLVNTVLTPVHIEVLVNGVATGLDIRIPAGSTSVSIGQATVNVRAGDLVAIRTDAIEREATATPVGYPPPTKHPPENFSYNGTLQYTTTN